MANLPEWTTVLEVMVKSRRADLAFRTAKQERWNQRAQDKQAYMDFLEEHRGTGKFQVSGKYAPQPQQTELIWTMPWGCWVELKDKDVHCKECECIKKRNQRQKPIYTNLKEKIRAHRASSKATRLFLTK